MYFIILANIFIYYVYLYICILYVYEISGIYVKNVTDAIFLQAKLSLLGLAHVWSITQCTYVQIRALVLFTVDKLNCM